jgi:hypothetical protein
MNAVKFPGVVRGNMLHQINRVQIIAIEILGRQRHMLGL